MALMESAGKTFGGLLAGGLGGAAVGGAANLLTGAIDSLFNKNRIKQQVEAQKELTDYNTQASYRNQMKIWEETNFPAQRKMMEQAGLNPALMYGKGGAGGGTVGAPATTGSVQSSINSNGAGIAMMAKEGALLDAQINNINADTKKKESEAATQAGMPNVQESQIKSNESQAALNTATAQLTDTRNKLDQLNYSYKQETYDTSIKQFNELAQQTTQALQQMKNDTKVSNETVETKIKQQMAELSETYINIKSKQAGINLTEKQAWQIGQIVAQNWNYVAQGQQNANTNTQNARTNTQNASTNSSNIQRLWEELTIKKDQLRLNDQQLDMLKENSTWNNFATATKSLTNLLSPNF